MNVQKTKANRYKKIKRKKLILTVNKHQTRIPFIL